MVTTMIKVTPKIDIVFKKLFGVEENKDLLISLINSIVSKEDQVVDVTILNPYNLKNFLQDKLSILDVKAKSVSGKLYNIEIQISDEADYDKRALYYWAELYTQQLKKSDDYSKLNKAIGIHILNFTSIPEVKKYHNVFHLLEKDDKFHFFKDIELHTIELKKFENNKTEQKLSEDEEVNLFFSKIKTSLDRWVAFLTRCDLLESSNFPSKIKDTNLQKAIDVLNVMSFDEKEREAYENRLKWLRIEANSLLKAERKGMEKGMEKGIKKGEKNKAVEIARKLLDIGISSEQISSATGLPVPEIMELKK